MDCESNNIFISLGRCDIPFIKHFLTEYLALVEERTNFCVRYSATYGHLDALKFVVSMGGNPRMNYDFPLRWASNSNRLEVVKYLVSVGADVKKDTLAIRFAAENGHFEMVEYLYEVGASIQSDLQGPLQMACLNGHLSIVKFLISKGSDARAFDDYAFRVACYNGRLSIVKFLLENLFKNSLDGKQYLFVYYEAPNIACRRDHFDIVKLLSDKGADVSKLCSKCKKRLDFCKKMRSKILDRAQKKIYFWWIPICYSFTHPSGCGKRMAQKNLEKFQLMCLESLTKS